MRTGFTWIVAIAALPVAAQTATFETGVTNIHVDVNVVYQGKSVQNLTQNDFIVRDQGQTRPILSFDEDTVPLDLVFLLDTNWGDAAEGGTKKSARAVAALASSALQQMRSFDRTAVISVALDPHVEQELTSDSKLVAAAIQRIPHGSEVDSQRFTALRWAAYLLEADRQASFGFGQNAKPVKRKRAVFIVANEHPDLPAQMPDQMLIEQYWGSDISLNTIAIKTDPKHDYRTAPRFGDIGHVAQATGGEAIVGASKDAPEKQIPDLLARIQSSYTLFYAPPAAKSGEVRHITVELSDEAKKKYPGAVVHAREGYIAK